jgi:lipoprotein-anchoring transpeptidase ErfK/SrfK
MSSTGKLTKSDEQIFFTKDKGIMQGEQFSLSAGLQRRCMVIVNDIPDHFVFITAEKRQLFLVKKFSVVLSYTVSLSKFGIGNQKNSLKTPTGIHRIIEMIGAHAPAGRIFNNRIDTGLDWRFGLPEENNILSRIIRLDGLEPGINRGGEVDTFERYIYIHGASKERCIGAPLSHGCVCMRNQDIIELFDAVTEGLLVFID